MHRRPILLLALVATAAACGGDDSAEYRFVGPVTACESAAWAQERQSLLEAGDTTAANRFASPRCFRVEPQRRVRMLDREGGPPWGIGRWVEVETVEDAALEHLASAELRRATGLPIRTRGWVAGASLREVE